jgi:tetratricopeptide (TPR) repeat protein
VRAYVLHALGQHREAMNLLAQAAKADQRTSWWRWAARWAVDAQAARDMDGDVVAGTLARVVLEVNDPAVLPSEREPLEAVLPALQTLAAAHPMSDPVQYMRVAAVRKLGRCDEAVGLAEEWHATSPSYMSALSLATARHRTGDIDGSVAAYEQTLAFQPGNAPVIADVAEMLVGARRFEEALAWTERAKANDPKVETSSWILWHHLMHKLDRDPAAMQKLAEFRRTHPNLREPGQPALRHFGAYAAFIPEPNEATVNMVRDLAEKHDVKKVKLTQVAVTSIECPSSRLAIERAMDMARNGLKIESGEIPKPDPRVPRATVDWIIWKYDGTTPLPGLEPPAAQVSERVVSLAATPYAPAEWLSRAADERQRLIEQCGSAESAARELLAIMVHPPAAPLRQAEWTWIRQVQFAAAAVLARIDDGWAGSVRRRAMIALVRGPVDWTTEAGIVMLALICEERALDESAKREIGQLLKELSDSLPSVGYCCYAEALAWAAMRLPAEAGISAGKDFAPLWERLREDES